MVVVLSRPLLFRVNTLLEPIMSTRGRKGPGTKKSRKGAPQPREGTPDTKPPIVNLIRADSNPPANESQVGLNGFLTPTGGTPVPNGVPGSISQMELDHEKVDDDDKDPEYQAWKKITKKGRAKIAVSLVLCHVLSLVAKECLLPRVNATSFCDTISSTQTNPR